MCPRTGRSLKARAWRHGSGFSSRLHVGYISDTIFIGLAKGLVWRTEEGVFCVRQMQGGKREEACLERRRLDNAVESDVEEMDDTSRYTRYRYRILQSLDAVYHENKVSNCDVLEKQLHCFLCLSM